MSVSSTSASTSQGVQSFSASTSSIRTPNYQELLVKQLKCRSRESQPIGAITQKDIKSLTSVERKAITIMFGSKSAPFTTLLRDEKALLPEQTELQKLCKGVGSPGLNSLRVLYIVILEKFLKCHELYEKSLVINLAPKTLKFGPNSYFKFKSQLLIFSYNFFSFQKGESFPEQENFHRFIDENLLKLLTALKEGMTLYDNQQLKHAPFIELLDPLIEYLTLFSRCLKDREKLFPLILCPLSNEGRDISKSFHFFKTLCQGLAYGYDEGAKRLNTIITKYKKKLKLKEFDKQKKELEEIKIKIEAISKQSKQIAASSDLLSLQKKFGSVNNTPNLEEILKLFDQLDAQVGKVHRNYNELMDLLSDDWRDDFIKACGPGENFSFMIPLFTEPMHLFNLVYHGQFELFKKKTELFVTYLENHRNFLSQKKSLPNSYFISNFDHMMFLINQEVVSLCADQPSQEIKVWLNSTTPAIGMLRFFLDELNAKAIYRQRISLPHMKQIFAVLGSIITIRNDKIPILKKAFNLEKEVEKLDELLMQIQEMFLLFAENHARFGLDQNIDQMSRVFLYALVDFYVSKENHQSNFTPELLQFFNQQLKCSRSMTQNLTFNPVIKRLLKHSPEKFSDPELKEFAIKLIEDETTIFQFLERVKKTFISYPELKDKEDCLKLAMQLISFKAKMFNYDMRYTEGCFDWIENLSKVSQNDSSLSDEFLNQFIYYDCLFFSHYASLIQWAKPELLLSLSSSQKQPVNSEASSSTSSPIADSLPSQVVEVKKTMVEEVPKTILPSQRDPFVLQKVIHGYLNDLKKTSLPSFSGETREAKIHRQQQLKESLELIEGALFVLEERELIPQIHLTPFVSSEIRLFYSALSLEQALKYRLSFLFSEKYEQLRRSHDLLKLLDAAQISDVLSEKERLAVHDARNVVDQSSRYLWATRGVSAELLRQLVLDEHHQDCLDKIEKMSRYLLSGVEKVLGSLREKTDEPIWSTSLNLPRLATKNLPLKNTELMPNLQEIEILARQLEIHYLGSSWERIQRGKTQLGKDQGYFRERVVFSSIKEFSYTLFGIREVLPHFFDSEGAYSNSNFLLTKSTLLVEHSLRMLLAYLDIPSKNHPEYHVLFDKVGNAGAVRLRMFDHNVKIFVQILQDFLGKERLNLSQSEIESISSLEHFLGKTSRYLLNTENGGEIAKMMKELRLLTAQLKDLRDGFHTQQEIKELKKQYGDDQSKWYPSHLKKLEAIKQEQLFPKICDLLKATQKLLELSVTFRKGV